MIHPSAGVVAYFSSKYSVYYEILGFVKNWLLIKVYYIIMHAGHML